MKRILSWPVRAQLVLLVFAAIVPALIIILVSGFEREQLEMSSLQQSAQGRVEDIADAYSKTVAETRRMLQTLAALPEACSTNPEPCNQLFARLLRDNPELNTLQVSRDGMLFASGSPFPGPIAVSDRKYWRDAVANRDFSVGEYIIGRTVLKPQLNFAYPVVNEQNDLVAIIQAGFTLDFFQKLLEKYELPSGAIAIVTDHAGTVLNAHPRTLNLTGRPDNPELFTAMTNRSGFFSMGSGTNRSFVVYNQLRLVNSDGKSAGKPYAYIRLAVPEAPMRDQVRALFARNLGLLALAAAFALLAALKLGDATIVNPVRTLSDAMYRFGEGDLTVRTVPLRAAHELQHLREGFNNMADLIASREREREQDKEALKRSEQRFRLLFNSTTDCCFVHEFGAIGKPGRFIVVNDSACTKLGYSREEFLSMTPAELDAPGMGPSDEVVEHLMLNRSVLWEGALKSKSGIVISMEMTTRLFEMDGRDMVLSTARDITEREEAEKQKLQLEEQLRHSQKMEAIGRLAGGVAHDFNNILTAILGNAELLLEEAIDDETRSGIEEIRRVSLRAAGLTRQLLTFSRKQVVTPTLTNVNKLIQDSKEMIERLIGEHITLVFHPEQNLASILVDAPQLDQIIMNLAVNARDAMPKGGHLILETRNCIVGPEDTLPAPGMTPGHWISISVSDTGCGMTSDTLQRLFEPFFTTKEKGKGTGLGLATVYGIVKQSAGAITVISEIGVGSRFTLYFPKAMDPEPEEPAVADEVASTLSGSESILLVEDETSVREMARRLLEGHGYKVITAPDGIAALSVFDPRKFDILVTDVVMPGMNGYELHRALETIKPDLKVLYMSGHIDDQFVQTHMSEGHGLFVQKPFKSATMLKKLREALDQRPH